jgi:Ca2+-binding EF-hand superfamily protein
LKFNESIFQLSQIARAQEAFILLDKDSSGNLDSSELRVALQYMGVKEDKLDPLLTHVLNKLDPSGTKQGVVSLDEFISLFTNSEKDETISFIQEGFKNITDDLISEFNKRAQV